jgi:diguanylate cyclase (GGDEF)-like protein/PAS domain S-box-containing protein
MGNALVETHDPIAVQEALQNCAREAISQIGSIQSAGVLIAVIEASLTVCSVSANLSCLLPSAPVPAIGQPLARLLGDAAVGRLQELIQARSADGEWPGAMTMSLSIPSTGQRQTFDAQVFRSDGLLVLEIELEQPERGDVFHELFLPIRDALFKADAEADIERYTHAVVDKVRLLTGYDRVMIYRFDTNWDGEVIAESKIDEAAAYIGHHFPASDIPPQARALYTQNLVRLVSDVNAVPIPVVGNLNPLTGQALMLTHSWLRSLSPMHVKYLRNMGVKASMSISLVQNDRLWGLIACHHFTPKYVSLRSRELNEFIGRLVSLKLINMDHTERATLNSRMREVLHKLTEQIRHSSDLDAVIHAFRAEFLGLVRAGGAIISIDNYRHVLGAVPVPAVVDKLVDQLREQAVIPVFHTDHLAEIVTLDEAELEIASGMMVSPLDHVISNFVMWFRPGIVRTLRWAGRPDKVVTRSAEGLRLSPRTSFETWTEIYRDKSLPWSQAEVDAANALSLVLIEALSQRALETSEESYRLLADNSTDMIARLDLSKHFTFVSPASMELLGFPKEVLLGQSIQYFILADDIAIFDKTFAGLTEAGISLSALVRFSRVNGKVIWVEAKLKRMHSAYGEDEIVVNARDVSQRHTYQLAIEEMHRRNTRILDSAGDGLMSLDISGQLIYVNEVASRFLGRDAETLVGGHCCKVLCEHSHVECPERGRCPFLLTLHDAETRQGRLALLRGEDNPHINLAYVCTPLIEGDRLTGCVVVLSELPTNHATTDIVLDQATEAVMVTDAEGNITSVNPAFCDITGYAANEVLGQNPRILRSGVHTPHFYSELWHTLSEQGRWTGEIWNRRKNGEVYPQWGSISCVLDKASKLRSYVAVFSDISKDKQAEEKLYHLANHDVLTGLPNRMKFNDQLANALERAKRGQNQLAVVFIDLDRFKLVNDTLGHAVGDLYLKQVAERLAQGLRKQDTLSRWGGDEFVIFLDHVGSRTDIAETVGRLLTRLAQPIILSGHELVPTASFGISVFPDDGKLPGDLIRTADAAMYRAKEKGRNGFEFYAEHMSTALNEKLNLASELRRAIPAGELRLHYQPQIDAISGGLHGVEALVRWQHPTRGLLPPGSFIAIAEELGLIEELGLWVLKEACRQFMVWSVRGVRVPLIAVNVAPRQLKNVFVGQVAEVLASSGIPPSCLELEITEGALETGDIAREITFRLRDLGVLLSIDDFGTGYSSLSHLRRMPVSCFKIDKSFIDGLPESAEDAAIVNMILALGSSLKINVVAEGVETAAQVEFLCAAGVRNIQGFYYARPMPAAGLEAFIAGRSNQ